MYSTVLFLLHQVTLGISETYRNGTISSTNDQLLLPYSTVDSTVRASGTREYSYDQGEGSKYGTTAGRAVRFIFPPDIADHRPRGPQALTD